MKKDIYNRLQQLPLEKQEEVQDFVDFLLEKEPNKTRCQGQKRKLGQMRGTVKYISPDFDASLEIFSEYMGDKSLGQEQQ